MAIAIPVKKHYFYCWLEYIESNGWKVVQKQLDADSFEYTVYDRNNRINPELGGSMIKTNNRYEYIIQISVEPV